MRWNFQVTREAQVEELPIKSEIGVTDLAEQERAPIDRLVERRQHRTDSFEIRSTLTHHLIAESRAVSPLSDQTPERLAIGSERTIMRYLIGNCRAKER